MRPTFFDKQLSDLFQIKSGDYHATKQLRPGTVPLVSCADGNNGVLGYFDIPNNKIYEGVLTTAYNGQPLTTKFHPYKFGTKDDVAILIPKIALKETTLLYIAAILNNSQWRFHYGRKCYHEKMELLKIRVPIRVENGQIDEEYISRTFLADYKSLVPENRNKTPISVPEIQWQKFNVLDVFDVKRGDFHSISALTKGEIMTISRVGTNNGVAGYYEPPKEATIYPPGRITFSTVSGDTFLQLNKFIATDNVLVCTPKSELQITTLYFLAFMLDAQKWRYSYGRQCYLKKFSRIQLEIPVTRDGAINEAVIEGIIKQASYWQEISKQFESQKE